MGTILHCQKEKRSLINIFLIYEWNLTHGNTIVKAILVRNPREIKLSLIIDLVKEDMFTTVRFFVIKGGSNRLIQVLVFHYIAYSDEQHLMALLFVESFFLFFC